MKLRIPTLQSLPQLPMFPRWLVSLAADGGMAEYRLQMQLNGRYQLLPDKLPTGQACVVVVDRSLPYRRKLQRFPDTSRSRLAILSTTPDEFPMPASDMLYSIGLAGKEGYLYALARQKIDVLQERDLRPVVILVSGGTVDTQACLDAIESYFRLGQSADMYRSGRWLSRRTFLQFKLSVLMATLLVGCLFLAGSDSLVSILEWRLASLRQQGGTLPRLYNTTEKMAYAQKQAAVLYAKKEAQLPAILSHLFDTVPQGHSLRKIELKDGVLKISGTGVDVREWLTAQGFPLAGTTVENMGAFQRFHAERTL